MLRKAFLSLVKNYSLPKGRGIMVYIVLIIGMLYSFELQAQHEVKKIVIDAGHGGKDAGASGRYSKEKDVVLSIALKTGNMIKKQFPEVEVIYTRKTDVFIPLKRRAEIANQAQADLFISIHCNANPSSSPRGSETYVMGLHRSEANLRVAKKENAAILFEDDYQSHYDGFDPSSPESHIIFNLFQNTFQAHNLDFAGKVQNYFDYYTPLKNRGVKQAGFWVLYKTTMPGVLIETGFLSNSTDEKFLNSKKGQDKICRAIVLAISDYKNGHDTSEALKQKPKPTDTPTTSNKKKPALEYKVQFLSLSTKKTLKDKKYKTLKHIESYHYKGLWRYTAGSFSSKEQANAYKNTMKKKGFKGAFVVAFKNGKRI